MCTLKSRPAQVCLKDVGVIGHELICLRDRNLPGKTSTYKKGKWGSPAGSKERRVSKGGKGSLEPSTVYPLEHVPTPTHTNPSSAPWVPCHSTPDSRNRPEKQNKEKSLFARVTTPPGLAGITWLYMPAVVAKLWVTSPFTVECPGFANEVCGHMLCGDISVGWRRPGGGATL